MSERGKVGAREAARAKRDAARADENARWQRIEKDAARYERLDGRRIAAHGRLAAIHNDQAHVVRRMVDDHGLPVEEIAGTLSVTVSDVRRMYRLATVQPEIAVRDDANSDGTAPTDTPNPERNPS